MKNDQSWRNRPKIPFSAQDDNAIVEHVRLYPTNLKKAFEDVSLLLNRHPNTISNRWYFVIRHRPDVSTITCGSSKGFTKNVKNIKRNADGLMPEQDLRGVEYIMKELLSLSAKDRKKIINFFK